MLSETEWVATSIGVVGTVSTLAIGLTGLLFRRSFDARTSQLQASAVSQAKTESTMRAFELLRAAADEGASIELRLGALFALAELKHHDLSLSLLRRYWKPGGIRSAEAVTILDRAFQSGDERFERLASGLLLAHSGELLDEIDGFVWPSSLRESWPAGISTVSRQLLVRTLLGVVVSGDRESWEESTAWLELIRVFFEASSDDDEFISHTAFASLELMLAFRAPVAVRGSGRRIALAEMKKAIEDAKSNDGLKLTRQARLAVLEVKDHLGITDLETPHLDEKR